MFSTLKAVVQAYFIPAPTDPARLAAVEDQVEELIKSPIAVFSKSYCPYCTRAKSLLSSLQQDSFTKTIELDHEKDGPAIQSYLAKRAGVSRVTVPQIYIQQKLIGGCSELLVLHSAGKLAPLLSS